MATLDDYIEDRRFVKWALEPDAEIEAYYSDYLKEHPEEQVSLMKACETLQLISVEQEVIPYLHKSALYKEIVRQGAGTQKPKRRSLIGLILPYAAVAILFFAIGAIVINLLGRNNPIVMPESLLVKGAALNTMVYLADGSRKEVGDTKIQIDFSQPGLLILDVDTLRLCPSGKSGASNMVVVPFGKRTMVKLYDNSLVELKAGSRLLMPEKFSAGSRSVHLLGEAFFDIRHDSLNSFFLTTTSTEINVLGTSFRVEAYPDEEQQTTFLKEGKIRLRRIDYTMLTAWTELLPNQQAETLFANGQIVVAPGDSVSYNLWKKGIVQINNEPLEQVVKKVERYFNISIQLKDPDIRNRVITGKMNLDTELAEVFNYLERITDGRIEKVNAGEFVLK